MSYPPCAPPAMHSFFLYPHHLHLHLQVSSPTKVTSVKLMLKLSESEMNIFLTQNVNVKYYLLFTHNPQTFLLLEYMPQGLDLFPSAQVIGRNKRFTRIARIAKITRITKNARFTNVKRFIRNNILYSNLNWKIYHYFIILGLTAHQV